MNNNWNYGNMTALSIYFNGNISTFRLRGLFRVEIFLAEGEGNSLHARRKGISNHWVYVSNT